jgi:hypothetical protein
MKKMKKLSIALIALFAQTIGFSQCNFGLNLGTVVVPSHGNASNGGNFTVTAAWQQAAKWVDSLNLDYHQPYIKWTDVVTQITSNVPTYTNNFTSFQNQINTWAGSPNMHVVYPTIKIGTSNTLETFPPGFGSFSSFLDTSYINQNYNAIKYILNNCSNVKWISIGNEIDAYFGGANLNTGKITQYNQFLNIMKTKINTDFPTVKVGTIFAFHNLIWSSELNLVDSILPSVDYVGYTFYYTTTSAGTCWDAPGTVQSWLNTAKAKAGTKRIMLTETSMGNGGGTLQNCGSPQKQQNYADSLLLWYNSNISNVEGMTWFTVVDPYLGWQTPNTLWNTCGLVDSNGVTIQPAGNFWKHNCPLSVNEKQNLDKSITVYPNPGKETIYIKFDSDKVFEVNAKLYTILGIELETFNLHKGENLLDISKYGSGTYFIKIDGLNGSAYKKIIIP